MPGPTCLPPEDSVYGGLDVGCQGSPAVEINQVEAAFTGSSQAVVFISVIKLQKIIMIKEQVRCNKMSVIDI